MMAVRIISRYRHEDRKKLEEGLGGSCPGGQVDRGDKN